MKIHMIYLAAGNSRRFGSNKLLYSFRGLPLYQYGLKQLRELLEKNDNYTLDVVTQYDEIIEYIKELSCPRLYSIKSEKSHLGLSYSIQAGIQKYSNDKDCYFLFLVADQPYIQSSTIKAMVNLIINNHALLGTVKYQQQVGNPTMFHCQLYNELMKLKGDEGGRKIIDKYSSVCLKVPVMDRKELYDYDYLQDIKNNEV